MSVPEPMVLVEVEVGVGGGGTETPPPVDPPPPPPEPPAPVPVPESATWKEVPPAEKERVPWNVPFASGVNVAYISQWVPGAMLPFQVAFAAQWFVGREKGAGITRFVIVMLPVVLFVRVTTWVGLAYPTFIDPKAREEVEMNIVEVVTATLLTLTDTLGLVATSPA
jgi:hypothetical protein